MGEIHYSRLPADEWRDALLKMKAGGINIAASYSFWIHHEEIRGEWDFSGCRNLRLFTETVKDCGLYMFYRIGPWSHGEARNGGFPDWLLNAGCELRSNNAQYLKYVEEYYTKLYEQARGLLFKDGGPIIGVQIENEYGHCGGLTGDAGEEHMRTLTRMAKEIGFDVPLYTATGWNGAVTGGLLPVMGGYCDAPWDPRIVDIEPSGNYVFSNERNDLSIGRDFNLGTALSFDMAKFPFITAELGGGLQVTKHRRVITASQDIAAMSVVKMGSGVNLLGYYMYHGGLNPEGKPTTLQESKETGGYNDLPVLSYDFQAPLGAYGQYNETYHELRLLGMFAADFGEALCKMPAYLPDDNPQNPADKERFRYSFRHNGKWGFVFFSNYVRHMHRPAFSQVAVTVPKLGLELPEFDVLPWQFGFYPFNMPVQNGFIKFAKATPLCLINKTTVLYGADMDASGDVLLISRDEALHAYKITGGQDHLIISDDPIIQDGDEINIFAAKNIRLKVFPSWENTPGGLEYKGMDGVFAVYEMNITHVEAKCNVTKTTETRYRLQFKGLSNSEHDCECHISYTAESAKAFINGRFIMDDFYKDGKWQINLRRHNFPQEIEIELNPLHINTGLYLEAWPPMPNGVVCRLNSVKLVPVTRVRVTVC
jgi:hypothetical protein